MTDPPHYEVAGDADGAPVERECTHLSGLGPVEPSVTGACEDCLREGTRWVHLRLCLGCGHMGCCDNSPRRHATAHWNSSHHPIIASAEPGEEWAWCYADSLFLMPADAA
jgi:hypothetical protein